MNAAVLERGQKGGLAGRRRQGKGRQTDTDRASDRQMDKHGKVIDSWSGGESSRSVCSVCWSGFKTYTLHSPCPSIYPQSPSVCSPFCLLYFSPRAASCSSRHGDLRFLKTAPHLAVCRYRRPINSSLGAHSQKVFCWLHYAAHRSCRSVLSFPIMPL